MEREELQVIQVCEIDAQHFEIDTLGLDVTHGSKQPLDRIQARIGTVPGVARVEKLLAYCVGRR